MLSFVARPLDMPAGALAAGWSAAFARRGLSWWSRRLLLIVVLLVCWRRMGLSALTADGAHTALVVAVASCMGRSRLRPSQFGSEPISIGRQRR